MTHKSKYNTPYIQLFNTNANNYGYKSLESKHSKPHIYGAGILPFQKHTDGSIYFLLGQDKDGTWSDFGGRVDPKDKNTDDTAVREFYEETIGVVLEVDTARAMLKSSQHSVCVESKTLNGSPYYMHLLRVPYQNYREEFKKFYKFLKYIHSNDKYLEKIDMRWISQDTLINATESDEFILLRRVFKSTIMKHLDTIKKIHVLL